MTSDQLSNLIDKDTTVDKVEVPPSSPPGLDLIGYKDLFKPRYRPRYVKNKGAILILDWNYAAWSVFSPINSMVVHNQSVLIQAILIFCVRMVGSITGWLADVRFGRYRVITWSAWIMWISSVLMTLSSVIAHLVEPYKNIDSKVSLAFLIVVGLGYCGFTINLLQFGVDQLHDASTTEITSFIAWFVGTLFSGQFSPHFVSACVQKYAPLIRPVLITFYLTVLVVTHSLLSHWLIKEPITQNPFKLAYNVLKYAIKNKYPRQRNAFTYCEDIIPSRIDFGKHKYGGPFTTEQVEDFKILFLTLIFIVVNGIFLALHAQILKQLYCSKVRAMNHCKHASLSTCSSMGYTS